MRIEVWTPPEPKPEPEKVVRLRVCRPSSDNRGYLWAVSENGSGAPGHLLAIFSAAGLKRIEDVDPALGFPLDDKGRIVLVGED